MHFQLPTAASGLPEWRKGAAVVFGLRVRTARKKRWKWVKCHLLVLLGRRGREEEQTRARDTTAARWWPAGTRVVVACAEKDSRGGEQGRGRGRATHGARPSRRLRRGEARAAVSGANSRRQRSRAEE
jgi:hypothetical protein